MTDEELDTIEAGARRFIAQAPAQARGRGIEHTTLALVAEVRRLRAEVELLRESGKLGMVAADLSEVRAMRSKGATWKVIGDHYGASATSAMQWFRRRAIPGWAEREREGREKSNLKMALISKTKRGQSR